MTSDSYRTFFIPFGPMIPDSPEFTSKTMEHVVNYIPVYSGYRPVVRPVVRSELLDADPVTGSHVHRSTERTDIEILQPLTTKNFTTGISINPPAQPLSSLHEVLRGQVADDGSFIIFTRQGSFASADGEFQTITRDWSDTLTDLITAILRYRIPSGSTGNYDLELGYGTFTGGTYTELAKVAVAGDLAVDGDDVWKTIQDSAPLSLFPDPIEDEIIGWQVRANLDGQTGVEYWGDETLAQSTFTIVGGDAQVHLAVDKSGGADDARYVTVNLGVSAEDKVQVGLPDLVRVDNTTIKINVRYEVNNQEMKLLVDLLEGASVVESFEIDPPAKDVPIDAVIDVSSAAYDAITNLNDLSYRAGFRGDEGAGVSVINPVTSIVGDDPPGSWTQYGVGDPVDGLNDSDDGTGQESSETDEVSTNTASVIVVAVPVPNPPIAYTATAAEAVCRVGAVNGKCVYQIQLNEGGTEIFISPSFSVEDAFTDFSLFLNQNQFTSINDWTNLNIAVLRRTNQGADLDATSRLAEASIVTDGGLSEGRVYEANYEQAGDVSIDVSWVQVNGALEGTFLPGDNIKLYFGLFTKLYELTDQFLTWTDVSKAGDYTSVGSTSWSFTTWGDKIIATNKINPVQVKNIGDTEFRDLFGLDNAGVAIPDYDTDGFQRPRARFVASINAFLCVANVDDASYVDGRPYTFWCSAIGDPTRMHPGDFNTQSSLFQIVSTPGEITGLVGGEYGLMFKEDSIYRVDYVGFPPIFNFEQLQVEQGTPYPRSIVQAGGDVYFWGAHGIFKIVNGRSVTDVSTGKVDKMLFDSLFEGLALDPDVSSDSRRNDSKVIGTYDPFSENIYWMYKLEGSGDYQSEAILCYNVHRDQFTILLATGLSLRVQASGVQRATQTFPDLYNGMAIDSLGNRQVTSTATMRGVFYVQRDEDPANTFNNVLRSFTGQETEQGLMDTNTIGSNEFPGAEGAREIDIQQIRPVYRTEKNRPTPKIDIAIEAGQFPDLDSGDVQIRSITTDNQNSDGWISVSPPLSGEFFSFLAQTEFTSEPSLKEFEGIQIRYLLKAFR